MGSAGTAAFSRLYHSTALLLPDATVVSMGSNPGNRGRYEPAIEIYTPSYLYDANDHLITTDRPQITGLSFSGPIHYGMPFSVSYTSTSPISSAVLIRPGSATHAENMEQRLIGLCGDTSPCSASGNTLSLTTPPDGSIAPPGYYMLFLLDSAGVPSKASFIQLTPNSYSLVPPSGAITTPSGDMTITAGSAINFGTNTSAANYSWVFPGGSPATSTAQNPGNVTFSTYGMYTVSLTVIDATGNSDPNPPTRTIAVLPTSPDFDITVGPAAQEVVPGGSTTYTVTVTPESGFTGYGKFERWQRNRFSYRYYQRWFQSSINYCRGLFHAHNADLDCHRALRPIADYYRYQWNDHPHGINDPTCQFGASCGADCRCRRCTSLALLASISWSKRVPREASEGRRRSV